ncbi:MAG: acyl-CoA thioesterase [Muribaculaceae bacterium]
MKAPDPKYPLRHITPVQIRFNDIDILGHLNNAVYLQFLDLAKAAYFRDVLAEAFDFNAIELVIVHIDIDFYAPSFIDTPLQVLTAVTRIGDRSLTVEQRVVSADTAEVKCVASTVLAGYDHTTHASAPISPAWRSRISAYEHRPL